MIPDTRCEGSAGAPARGAEPAGSPAQAVANELPLGMQPKLLRALQAGEIQRVGADHPLHVNVRLVAATNRDLREEVRTGRFRADLLHRLDVYRIHVAPLRARREDVGSWRGPSATVRADGSESDLFGWSRPRAALSRRSTGQGTCASSRT